MTMFRCLILITGYFLGSYFSVFSFVFVFIQNTYQALKVVFDQISNHLEVRQNYSATLRIFNFLLDVWRGGQTRLNAYYINAERLQGFRQFHIHTLLL